MADEYVTMSSWDLGPTGPSVANFIMEKGVHPRVAASQAAEFAWNYPTALKLRIMCHGKHWRLTNHWNEVAGVRTTRVVAPGYGLLLNGDLWEANMIPTVFSFVQGCFDAITLIACGAAGTSPIAIPWGEGDGPGLCRTLAATANTPVWAADASQVSRNPSPGGLRQVTPWIGNVFLFPPDGGPGKLMRKAKLTDKIALALSSD